MTGYTEPVAELDARFSSEGATPAKWEEARERLKDAEVFWLSTVRPDGRPHVTPLIAVWLDDALYFCTGPNEQKAKNLAHNRHCTVTTGCNTLGEGLDLVVEGAALRVNDEGKLRASPRRMSRSTAVIGASASVRAPSFTRVLVRAGWPWCSRLLP